MRPREICQGRDPPVISMNRPPSRTMFQAHVCAMVAVAQLVEHQIVVLRVAGSSPVSHPKDEQDQELALLSCEDAGVDRAQRGSTPRMNKIKSLSVSYSMQLRYPWRPFA